MKALQCQAEDEGLALQAVGAPEGIQAGKWPGKKSLCHCEGGNRRAQRS